MIFETPFSSYTLASDAKNVGIILQRGSYVTFVLTSDSHVICIDSVARKMSFEPLDYYQESRHGLCSILKEVSGNESTNFENTMYVLEFETYEYSTAVYPFPLYLSISVSETMFISVIGQLVECSFSGQQILFSKLFESTHGEVPTGHLPSY